MRSLEAIRRQVVRPAVTPTLSGMSPKRAAFLDRDGVINVERNYVHRPEEFSFVEGAPAAIARLRSAGYRAIVVTNQSGIGRGYYSEAGFQAFTRWIDDRLAEHGAYLDATFYCPHHPEAASGAYLASCLCRKPAPGLIRAALAEFDLDPDASFLIGDKDTDIAAAEAAGVRGYLFAGGNLLRFVESLLESEAA
jgi:D-glycero-D-manno-heptose 1,7-bisphosphate phosphatase